MTDQADTGGARYKAFDCGDSCHLIRYDTFTTRTWWGGKRWGVVDRHLGQRLTARYRDQEAFHNWLVRLRAMEVRERRSMETRARRAGSAGEQ